MKPFFNPAVRLVSSMSYPKKLLLLFCIFFIVICVLAFQILNPLIQSRNLSKVEMSGIELLLQFQRLRHVIFENIRFKQYTSDSSIDEIDRAFEDTAEFIQKIGNANQTLENFKKIITQWNSIKNTPEKYRETTEALRKIVTETCDVTNLINDPDIDISYLADAACYRFTNLSEYAVTIRDLGAQAFANKSISEENRDHIFKSKNSYDIYVAEIKDDIKHTFDFNPRIEPTLSTDYSNYIKMYKVESALADKLLSRQFDMSPTEFYESFTSVLHSAYPLHTKLLEEIKNLLNERIMRNSMIIIGNVAIVIFGLFLFSYLFTGIYFSILTSVQKLMKGSREISNGNLNTKVDLDTQDELALVGEGFNFMREKLETLVKSIKLATQSIQGASEEIALGNADLSKHTIQEAASLEETSNTMNKIAETVRKNTENAQTSAKEAQSTMEIATNGVEVVNQMVRMMNLLNDSAQRITDIISVIDNVALQTNILALNAAVEAAHAGEQGRGFAVVAEEIRSLSKRSSDSAHGIKNLINNSVETIKEGTKLADEVLFSIENLRRSVNSLTNTMTDIADASIVQNLSIQQINSAINEIRHVTQQNSAHVEKAATAAESLGQNAKAMKALVEIFKVNQNTK